VDTVFKWLGPDHKIVVEAFDDPDVQNVTCYISRAKTGGIKGGWGWRKIPPTRRFPASRSGRLS
jgi:CreA protein